MKLKHGLALLTALLLAPFAGIARALAPSGTDALNAQGFYDGPFTRSAQVPIQEHLLVTFGSNAATQVALCTAATRPLGTAFDEQAANGPIGIIPISNGMPRIMIASKGISAGGRVFATAGGKVTDAVVSGAYLVGEALTAAAGDLSELTVMPLSPVINP